MSSQASFPDWERMPQNHQEQAIKLLNDTKQTLRLLEVGTNLPTNFLKLALRAFAKFLEEDTENPSNKSIIEAITRLTKDIYKQITDIEEKVRSMLSPSASSAISSSGRS